MSKQEVIQELIKYEENLVEKTSDAVVGIANMKNGGYGSGTHIGKGYILTNDHVITGADKIRIDWSKNKGTGYESSDGEIIFNIPSYDLAIVRDKDEKNYDKPKLQIKSEKNIKQGTKVCVIGCPLRLFNTVTFGHISATHRNVDYYDEVDEVEANLFQTDASINGGNSGGACVDYNGNLIGVPSAGMPNKNDIGFVIKIESIMKFIRMAVDNSDLELTMQEILVD